MKRFLLAALTLCLLLLCGCSERLPAMYIQPAQLTQAETDMMELLDMEGQQKIYDFKVDENIQRIELNGYELIDGEWQQFFGGGGRTFTDTEGRIALRFENIREGLWEAIQSESYNGHTGWESTAGKDEEETGTSQTSTMLTDLQEIVYEEEIPLAVQIVTSGDMIRTFDTTYFFHPEEYEEYGYDHVYAVTIRFSQEPLS